MRALPGIFSLLVAIAGWYYMFYSTAARKLSGIEDEQINQRRARLRRVSGFLMFCLSVCFFAGFYTFDPHSSPHGFVAVWVAVFVLLLLIVLLALVDLRLTAKLRRNRPQPPSVP